MEITGKTIVITGAARGLGAAMARRLASAGARLALCDLNKDSLADTAAQCRKAGAEARCYGANVAREADVASFMDAVASDCGALDVLINNAGAVFMRRQVTADNLEATFALNHMSYFLLTNLLLDRLRAAEAGRIIVVASIAHQRTVLNFDDLQCAQRYSARTAYSRSKLANIMFTYALARRLKDSSVTVNALHPGIVASRFGSNNGWLFRNVIRIGFRLLGAVSVEEGAALSIQLASDPALTGVSGRYFSGSGEAVSSPASLAVEDQDRLWAASDDIAAG